MSVCQRRSCFQGVRTARFCIKAGNSQKIWEKQGVPQLHTASFFKFIAANFSLTQVVTRARPRCCVYRIACFSFASANTRSGDQPPAKENLFGIVGHYTDAAVGSLFCALSVQRVLTAWQTPFSGKDRAIQGQRFCGSTGQFTCTRYWHSAFGSHCLCCFFSRPVL